MATSLVPRSEFLGLDGVHHLYTAAEGPLFRSSADAMAAYARQKARAEAGRAHHDAIARSCKDDLARLLNVDAGDIAYVASASEGINAVCGAIGLRPGDNVVINDLEFPSVALPWLRLRSHGIEVRVVRHEGWDIPADALLAAVDKDTRLVALSHVSYVNGLRHDIEEISAALREAGTLLLLDATQSLGVLPVPAAAADFVVSSTYKWLLGTHGLGILYWNRSRVPDLEPPAIGWYSIDSAFTEDRYNTYTLRPDAGRFEIGYVNFPAIYPLSQSVPRLLEIGSDRLASHALHLGDRLIDGLTDLGVELMSPRDPARRGASVSFAHPDASRIGQALADRQIHVWAGDGRVRASTHLFNDEDDVDAFLNALDGLVQGK